MAFANFIVISSHSSLLSHQHVTWRRHVGPAAGVMLGRLGWGSQVVVKSGVLRDLKVKKTGISWDLT